MAENGKQKASIFLSVEQAVRAICIDFRQYPPQTLLFANIIALISNNTIHLKRESDKNGGWINQIGHHNMRWLDGPELIDFMCEAISSAHWNPDLMAKVCSRVFQTKAFAVDIPDTHRAGVRIETNMETFSCRQCGNCCRSLEYQHELTDADISLWKALDRNDILKWVEIIPHAGNSTTYRIWVSPKTHQTVEPCPFLMKNHTTDRWQCRIHDVKPGICRQYPTSRKHALMTGCLGFHSNP